jgi:hypothetical protein
VRIVRRAVLDSLKNFGIFLPSIRRDRQKSYLLDALSLVGVASLVRLSLTPLENYKIQCQASWLVPSAPKPSLQWQWNASYMYRGASLSVSRYAVSFIILRFVKDSAFAPVLLVFPGHTTNTPHFVATGIAAYVAHYLLYPIDVLRCVWFGFHLLMRC